MNPSDLTLPEEDDWDHVLSLDLLISKADYAVLDVSTHLAKRVLLVEMDRTDSEKTIRYTALQWTPEDGVHYDGDGTMMLNHLAKIVAGGEAEPTKNWLECEAFLAPERVAT